MRIIHIIPSLKTGGAERLTLDICNELQKQKHEVALLTFNEVNEFSFLSNKLKVRHLPVYVRPSLFRKWEVNIEALNELITGFRPDIIHTHLFEAEILSRENIFPDVSYFTHCHDNMPQFRNFSVSTIFEKRRLTDFYEKQHLLKKYQQCNNRFIAISEDTKKYFEQNLPKRLRKNIFLLSNAIDFHRFNAVNHERSLNTIRMVNVGSFVYKKNQQFLVDVVSALTKMKWDVKLVMLGNGVLLNDVKRKIEELGLQNFIDCPGNVNTVEQYLSNANVYVHSATYEPFGLVLLEAMAAGLPVVALDGRGNRDILKNNENGILIENQNAQLFANQIISLFKNKDKYRQTCTSALHTARSHDIKEYVIKLLKLYQGDD